MNVKAFLKINRMDAHGVFCLRYWGENQVWFGELTFWPKAGCYKIKDEHVFGKMLDIDTSTTKPKVVE
jgi:hypothetical protein